MSGVHARAAVAALFAALALAGCSTFQRGPRDPNAPLPLANSGPPTGRYEPEEDPDEDEFFKAISPVTWWDNFKEAAGFGADEHVARAAFEEAEKQFRQKLYPEAGKLYMTAARRWPTSPLEEEALFMAGEAYFFADRYVKADDAYAELVKKHSGTQHLDKITVRRFAIASYWQQRHLAKPQWFITPNLTDKTRPTFDTKGHAIRVWGKLPSDDPTSPLADDAVMNVANTYFASGRYRDADHYYTMLRNEFPKSEHQFQAFLLGLRSKLLVYQGPDYDSKPLEEAEKVAEQLLTQFPRELVAEGEKERVLQARGQIAFQKALREWNRAEYYNRLEYYAAARMHYQTIVEKYPDTQLAASSRERIGQMQGLPDVPTPGYQWLVDLFPDSAKQGPSIKPVANGREQPDVQTAGQTDDPQRR
jgi:outer membrane protein assembly factor BamD (BamD/ComL family)